MQILRMPISSADSADISHWSMVMSHAATVVMILPAARDVSRAHHVAMVTGVQLDVEERAQCAYMCID